LNIFNFISHPLTDGQLFLGEYDTGLVALSIAIAMFAS